MGYCPAADRLWDTSVGEVPDSPDREPPGGRWGTVNPCDGRCIGFSFSPSDHVSDLFDARLCIEAHAGSIRPRKGPRREPSPSGGGSALQFPGAELRLVRRSGTAHVFAPCLLCGDLEKRRRWLFFFCKVEDTLPASRWAGGHPFYTGGEIIR